MILEIYDHHYRGAFILWINVRNTLIRKSSGVSSHQYVVIIVIVTVTVLVILL